MRTSRNILTEKEMELVELLMSDCQSTGDIQEKLKQLFAGTIEQMLKAEMDEHLRYDKNSIVSAKLKCLTNRRGYCQKIARRSR
ncbi:MAG: hypothetical protein FWE05_12245 [Defluviitaleaceae bacterium]|nr:hypothetical protein [Defluviitaleaceae bacterium]